MNISLNLNGTATDWEVAPGQTLLQALRASGAFSVKLGCETGDCGSCTVLLDGQPVNSCVVPAARVNGSRVTTLEGLLGDDLMIRLQTELVEQGAVQCGYCIPGMLISLYALLKQGPPIDEETIRHALTGNLCRCTGYVKPVEAARAVAAVLEETS
ncbi:MAG: (2Fe-2S)-binding protein [Candidatus Krumholzibacteria bacterium]|nr:(2Fe-2S)-binding protein [Candidatus Krumholzibacteria bacterium]